MTQTCQKCGKILENISGDKKYYYCRSCREVRKKIKIDEKFKEAVFEIEKFYSK